MANRRKYIYLVYVFGPFKNKDLEDDLKDGINFFNDNGDGLSEHDSADQYFYCWTTSKKTLKKFMEYRNEKRFLVIIKDISYMNDEEWDSFKSINFITEIKGMTKMSTVASKIKGSQPTATGLIDFELPVTNFEDCYVNNTMDWFDDKVISKFSDSSVVIISILIKCAKKDLLIALYNSGIVGLLSYISLLRTGDDLSGDYGTFLPEIDEISVFLERYGELFNFKKEK